MKQYPKQIIADYQYHIIDEKENDTVRFLLAPVEQFQKPFVLFVIAKPIISPMNYAYETYYLIQSFLKMLDLSFQKVEIFLDYEERFPSSNPHVNKWTFQVDKKKNVIDTLEEILIEELPKPIKMIREQYYENHLFK